VTAAEVREALAAAVNAVAGVSVTAHWRQHLAPGDGSVLRQSLTRPENGFGWLATWQVRILLSSDIAAAERWLDERAVLLAESLEPLMRVTSVAPIQFSSDGSTRPYAVIEGVREQD
jgi:hypothetical protein